MLFWGRAPVVYGTAGYFFQKKGHFQHMIHAMKYRGVKELGKELGKLMGYEMADSVFSETELIVPVPLHPEKLQKRGYNQSEWIAWGIGEALHKPVHNGILIRVIANETQTRKSRFDRWINVENVFRIRKPEAIQGKHVLLVDDVVTTGATLEACAHVILRIPGTKVSVATLAVA
jgi:ComF family protein